jgi:hypothetical protein
MILFHFHLILEFRHHLEKNCQLNEHLNYLNENMSISQKQSIITLLPQKNNDVRFLKNWRPVSLLNTDYKIMTKCIAQ